MKLYLTGFFSNVFVAEENFQGNLLIRIQLQKFYRILCLLESAFWQPTWLYIMEFSKFDLIDLKLN